MKHMLRNVMIILGCLSAALIFPAIIYAGFWALIGLLTLWPSIWCLFAVATVAAACAPALIWALGNLLSDMDMDTLKQHPVLTVAYGASLAGLTFLAYLYAMITVQIVPILGLAALALGLGGWVAFAIISEVSAADAIEIKGMASLDKAAPQVMTATPAQATRAKRGSRLAEVLNPQPVAVG